MGLRVHVVKVREKYGDSEAFNYGVNDFISLLNMLDVSLNQMDSEYETRRFECVKEDFNNALDILKEYKESGELKDFDDYDKEDIDKYIIALSGNEDFNKCLEYVIECMEDFLDECDKNSEWMEFVVW